MLQEQCAKMDVAKFGMCAIVLIVIARSGYDDQLERLIKMSNDNEEDLEEQFNKDDAIEHTRKDIRTLSYKSDVASKKFNEVFHKYEDMKFALGPDSDALPPVLSEVESCAAACRHIDGQLGRARVGLESLLKDGSDNATDASAEELGVKFKLVQRPAVDHIESLPDLEEGSTAELEHFKSVDATVLDINPDYPDGASFEYYARKIGKYVKSMDKIAVDCVNRDRDITACESDGSVYDEFDRLNLSDELNAAQSYIMLVQSLIKLMQYKLAVEHDNSIASADYANYTVEQYRDLISDAMARLEHFTNKQALASYNWTHSNRESVETEDFGVEPLYESRNYEEDFVKLLSANMEHIAELNKKGKHAA